MPVDYLGVDPDLDGREEDLEEEARLDAIEEQQVELDELSTKFVKQLVDKIVVFMTEFVGHELFPYQMDFARRMIESVLINDGEEVTALFSRQSGKTEVVSDVVATLMVLLPRLAAMYPELLGKFKNGFLVGMFAPTDEQVTTVFSRTVDRLTSDRATEILLDPEIDDATDGRGKVIKLTKSGSLCRMQTAHPRANIEGKTYHLIIVDEAQAADDHVVRKSIHPMGAFNNATIVKTGTPTTRKGDFYKAIQLNKRRQTRRGHRQNHFEANWKMCGKYNPNYNRYVRKEILRLGEDSDEFQLSYNLKWLLERGMFTTQQRIEELGDRSMELVTSWWKSPVVVGIDPARSIDSTVVTVLWVDWDRPDEFGYYDHRVLNWLELHQDDWEVQYYKIQEFLSNYDVMAVGVDSQGVGDAVADRLSYILPRTEVFPLPSDSSSQSYRWKHLMALMERGRVGWPAHAKARRSKPYRRFVQQMTDLEKKYQGKYMLAAAPEEAEAHDDYADSLALACILTKDIEMPEVEVSTAPFYASRRR